VCTEYHRLTSIRTAVSAINSTMPYMPKPWLQYLCSELHNERNWSNTTTRVHRLQSMTVRPMMWRDYTRVLSRVPCCLWL